MKFKKALATVLAICVAITFMPITPVTAETTVTYNRAEPEVAVLNAKNGSSNKFYDTLLHNTLDKDDKSYTEQDKYGYLNYNAAKKLFGINYEDYVSGCSSSTKQKTYTYKYTDSSVLYKLSMPSGNLEMNFSTTLHNNRHAHSVSIWLQEEMTAYTQFNLYSDSNLLLHENGSNYDMDDKRVGNYNFTELKPSSATDKKLKLWVHSPSLKYGDDGEKTCNCESYANKTVVAFRDARTPKLAAVTFFKDGKENTYFKKGDTITIELSFDEPIRFADDSAANKSNLYINLMLEGSGEADGLKAHLTKLDNNKLYFEYKVDQNSEIDKKITKIQLSSLAGSNIPLKQVVGSKNFTISAPSGEEATGYSTTTCYITDLAGNPLLSSATDTNCDRAVGAYIDCAGPTVAKIEVSANTNNSEVNAAIAKLSESEDNTDKNNSELYLAPGDSLDYTIYMNEYLAEMIDAQNSGTKMIEDGDYSKACTKFYAKTNLVDKNNKPVYIKSRYCCKGTLDGKKYGQGASGGYVSYFWMETLTIEEGYKYADNSDSRILITEVGLAESVDTSNDKFEVTGIKNITDTCGNVSKAQFDVKDKNSLTYYLDTELPTVTTELNGETKGSVTYYTPTPETTKRNGTDIVGFRFPIEMTDASGVNGLTGYFSWRNETSDTRYSYEYTVTTGDAELKDSEEWKSAAMAGKSAAGGFNEFTQVANSTIWIHIRPIEDENTKYNVLNSRICISAQDYAGNKGGTSTHYNANGDRIEPKTTDFELDWTLENRPPEITKKSVAKSVADGKGTLTVKMDITDDTGVDATNVYYLWADATADAPTAASSGWTKATANASDVKNVEAGAVAEISNGSNWSKVLWVKASDTKENTAIKRLGEYSYNLESVKYSITYDTNIINCASIAVEKTAESSSDSAALVFMIKSPNSETDASGYADYYVRVLGAQGGSLSVDRDIFGITHFENLTAGKDMDWKHMKVKASTDTTVNYVFQTANNSSDDTAFINSLTKGTYSGNLNVTVISGKQDAFVWDTTDTNIPVSAGASGAGSMVSTENITLRISSAKTNDAFENVIGNGEDSGKQVMLTCLSDIPEEPSGTGADWTPGSYTSLSTLVGLTFRAQIGEDKYDWDYEDVDWENSYVAIQKSGNTNAEKIKKIPIKASTDQTVTVSEGDFSADSESGYYEIWLVLDCKAGKDYSSEKTSIFVDTTDVSDFGIDNITYTPNAGLAGTDSKFYDNVGTSTFRISPVGAADNTKETVGGEGKSTLLYLPTSPTAVAETSNFAVNKMKITAEGMTSGYDTGRSYGDYKYKIWNVTSGVDLTRSEKNAYIGSNNSSISITTIDSAEKYNTLTASNSYVYLIKDTINTVAVQMVKANGKSSEIKYYNIMPTSTSMTPAGIDASKLANGTDVVGEGELIFYPNTEDTDGAHVYAAVEIARTDSSETKEAVKTRYAGYNPYAVYDVQYDSSKAAIVFELMPQADGTYRCTLLPGENNYYVYTIDRYGNLWKNEYRVGNSNTRIINASKGRVDTAAPQIELIAESQKESNGTYEAKFKITDLSLNAKKSTSETGINKYYANDLDIVLSIDETHAKAIGVSPGGATSLHIESESARSAEKTWKLSGNDISETGVYEISYKLIQEVERNNDDTVTYKDAYIKLTVKGAIGYDRTDGVNKVSFSLNVAASDIFGNTGTQSVQYTDADNVTPKAYTTGANAPNYTYNKNSVGNYILEHDPQLVLTFNAPVQPSASWICPEPKGYSKEQADAFPITEDGDYEIGYTDVFGNHWTQELAISVNTGSVGTACGVHWAENVALDFVINGVSRDADEVLPTDLTSGSLTITAKMNKSADGLSCIFLTTDANGESCFLSEKEDANYNKPAGKNFVSYVTNEKKITLTENKTIYLCVTAGFNDGEAIDINYVRKNIENYYIIPIHITNIANGAPTAEPLFYFEEFGDTYTKDTLPKDSDGKVKTTGAVTVSYKANRAVTPTGDTGSSVTFRYDEQSSHSFTFKFKDSLGKEEGTLKGSLEDYGIVLTAPAEAYADKDAPIVNVDILAKRFGAYKAAEAFSVSQGITSSDQSTSTAAKTNTSSAVTTAFENASYVQDYNLKIRVTEDSDYKIVLLKEEPKTALAYSTATSDSIANVSLSGNVVSISKDARTQEEWSQFTIAVVDNAQADSAATSDNYTFFTVKKTDIAKWFDNTKPELLSEVIAAELYSRIEYVTFKDKADDESINPNGATVNGMEYSKVGSTSTSSSAEATADSTHQGWFKKVHKTNTTDSISFYDSVGNADSGSVGVTGIDDTVPELSVEWSPCGLGSDGKTRDVTTPISKTSNPVNTPVTAVVESTRPIWYVEVDYVAGRDNLIEVYFEDMTRGTRTGDELLSRNENYGIKCEGTTNRVTVKFTEDNRNVKVRVTALNGQTAEMLLELGDGVIKTTKPTFSVEQESLRRSGYSVPYAERITIAEKDGEVVYYNGDTRDASGERKTYSKGDNAYKTIVYKNGTYSYTFTDKAGNVATETVKVTGIDNTAPTLTVSPENTSSLQLTSKDTAVNVTPNEDVTLTWKTAAGTEKTMNASANTLSDNITFDQNGVYEIKATDMAGNTTSVYVTIGNISRIIPNISFDKNTVLVRQQDNDTVGTELTADLKADVKVWNSAVAEGTIKWLDVISDKELENLKDNEFAVSYDVSALKLTKKGLQSVTYTVSDKAGNENTATRYVQVYDKDTPAIMIDGNFVEDGSTYALESGKHTLTMDKLKTITQGESEPYTVKIKKGMATAGQMKKYKSDVTVAEDGSFTLGKGFYTLYVVTQSRSAFIATLYVEK